MELTKATDDVIAQAKFKAQVKVRVRFKAKVRAKAKVQFLAKVAELYSTRGTKKATQVAARIFPQLAISAGYNARDGTWVDDPNANANAEDAQAQETAPIQGPNTAYLQLLDHARKLMPRFVLADAIVEAAKQHPDLARIAIRPDGEKLVLPKAPDTAFSRAFALAEERQIMRGAGAGRRSQPRV